MAGPIGAPLDLTKEQRQELTALSRGHSTSQKLAERARIVLLAADGVSVSGTAQRLGRACLGRALFLKGRCLSPIVSAIGCPPSRTRISKPKARAFAPPILTPRSG